MLNTILRPLAVAAVLTSPAIADETDWIGDFDKAVALAKETGKDLFVDFTGSDWCGWCIRLHDEVFVHDAFLKAAKEQYVLVALDFPRSEEALAKVPNIERNKELAATYSITGYPTILLMDAQGDVFGRTGYQEGGPEKYVQHMTSLRETGLTQLNEINELLKAYAEAEEADQIEHYNRILDTFEKLDASSPFRGKLSAPIKSDWKQFSDELQLRSVEALVTSGMVDSDILTATQRLDAKNEKGLYARAVLAMMETVSAEDQIPTALAALEAFSKQDLELDAKMGESLYILGAYWSKEYTKQPDEAKRYAKLGLKYTQDERYKQFFDQILGEE